MRAKWQDRGALGQDRMAAKLIARAYANQLDGGLQRSTQEIIDGIKAKRAAEAERAENDGDAAEPVRQ
jgi:hypothetical protein